MEGPQQDQDLSMGGLDDMADLFGEGQSVVTPALPTLSPSLARRVDELGFNGCRRRVAWSKSGAIAVIATDGLGVDIYGMILDSQKNTQRLSEPTRLPLPSYHRGRIVHISWGRAIITSDLAVIDESGGISIWSTKVALNQLDLQQFYPPYRNAIHDPVIGLEWLPAIPMGRLPAYFHTAAKQQDTWTYSQAHTKVSGPSHPVTGRNALLVVTQTGKLRLLYMNHFAAWMGSDMELTPGDRTEMTFTHVSFAPDNDDSFVLAVVGQALTIEMYRVRIKWHPNASMLAARGTPDLDLVQGIDVSYLRSIRNCQVEPKDHVLSTNVELTHLQLFPPTTEPGNNEALPMTIVALFTILHGHSDVPITQRHYSARLASWTLSEGSPETLHPAFAKLASKTNKNAEATGKPADKFERHADMDLMEVPVHLSLQRSNTMFAIGFCDGSVSFWDRYSMQRTTMQPEWNRVWSWTQAGLEFLPGDLCVDLDLSPNSCMAITEGLDGDLSLRMLQFQGANSDGFDNRVPHAAWAGQCLAFASSSGYPYNTDDLVSVMAYLSPIHGQDKWLQGLYLSCNIPVNYTVEEKTYFRLLGNMALWRCISIQQTLHDSQGVRTVPAKVASIMIASRGLCTVFHSAMTQPEEHPEDSVKDMPWSLRGAFQHLIDTMAYLVRELMVTQEKVRGREGDYDLICEKASSDNAIAIACLLTSVPRTFLKLCSRYVRSILDRKFKIPLQGRLCDSYQHLVRMIEENPIEPLRFERLLEELEHYTREAYDSAGCSEAQRTAMERDMLVSGRIPAVLHRVVHRLLTRSLDNLIVDNGEVKVDPMRILFHTKNGLIGVTEDAEAKRWRRDHVIDSIRKLEVMPWVRERSMRHCTRCGAVMENLAPDRDVNRWVFQVGRQCFCGSSWILVGPRKAKPSLR